MASAGDGRLRVAGHLPFVLLALLILAVLGVVWIMTGPRAAYWRGVFDAADYGRIVFQQPIIRTGGSRTEEIAATAEGRIATDRSQAFLILEATGDSPDRAVAAIADRRARLRRALDAAGYDDAQFNEGQLVVDPQPGRSGAESHHASLHLTVTFFEDVDFVDLFSRPDFTDIGRPEKQLYWISDREAALAPLEDEALAKARERAERTIAGEFTEGRVRFSNSLGDPLQKFTARILRVVVTARLAARIATDGSDISELASPGGLPADTSRAVTTTTAPPLLPAPPPARVPDRSDFSDK